MQNLARTDHTVKVLTRDARKQSRLPAGVQVLQFMPDWLVFDFKHMFRFFHEGGFQGSREAIERQTRLIGHEPRGFEGFARETAQAWGAAV